MGQALVAPGFGLSAVYANVGDRPDRTHTVIVKHICTDNVWRRSH
jgi:hypothetical protein